MKSYTCAPGPSRPALIGIAMTGSATVRGVADIKDYEFQLVDQAITAGPDKIITVRADQQSPAAKTRS